MGVFSYESEKTSTLPPARLYDAFVNKSHILFPKLNPNIQSVEIVEGNGGPGTIVKTTYVQNGKSTYGLRKVEALDEASLSYRYSIVGGDILPEYVDKICFEDKLVEAPNGGSIVTIIVKYYTKFDTSPPEDEINKAQGKADKFFRAVEAYLLANPDFN